MPLTWHQERGVERRLGLHRWMSDGDGSDSCLHCGTVVEHVCTAWLNGEACPRNANGRCNDDCWTRIDAVPMVCGPNDARLVDEHRDETYRPHHWMASTQDDTSECAYCGQVTDGSSNTEHTPYDDRPSCQEA